MGREIKFRAWDKSRGELLYGEDIEESIWPSYFTGLSYGQFYVAYCADNGDWVECDVMQCTGLKDRNGKEIYEGDVLHPTYNGLNPFVVEFKGGKFNCVGFDLKSCIVIGNKWESPELLEADSGR